MRLWHRIHSALRNLFRKDKVESQLDSELRSYVDTVTAERIAAGMPAAEARRTALAEFGGIEQVKQAVRDRRAGARVELLWQDLRYGVRQLARNPGFTVTVIVTLALSIGANTAIFSIVNALMLKSLPYPQPERMGTIFMHAEGAEPYDGHHWIDGEQWELLRDNVPSMISAVSSGGLNGVNLQAGDRVQYVHSSRVSAHYLDVLGVRPLLGRNFIDVEDQPHGPKATILSFALWRNTFGGDRDLVGQTIHLKGEPFTVVGVLPQGTITPTNADLYTALQPSRQGEGSGTNFEVITRLRDGATWQQANAELNRAWAAPSAAWASRHPGSKATYYTVPLQRGVTSELRPKAMTLMLAAGFILLIACANLAGLTLVRVARRTPEIATRLALGASQRQIQMQLWVENLLLALMGGLAGIGVGFAALRGLLVLLPKHYLPVAGVPLDLRVLVFTLTIALSTSVLFGMLPALSVRRVDLRSSIARGAVAGGERLRLRQLLIAGEVALTVVLLAGSGLLIRTLIHLQTLPPGFNPQGVMTAKASLDNARYHDPVAFQKLLSESTEAMTRIPGVTSAAVGLTLPFEVTLNGGVLLHNGPRTGKTVGTDVIYVTPGYFRTLEMPLLSGRDFTAADGANTQQVAIVNQTFARKFFPGEDPIGHTLDQGTVIVGVAGDTQLSSGLNRTAPLQSEETMYIPATQLGPQILALVHTWFQPSWIVRTGGPVDGLTAQMQHALTGVDPSLPFSGFYGMSDLQAETLATQRVEVALLSAMAGLALLLSAVGIFALVASLVAQRTREIGIRIALGSTVRQAMVHVSGSGVRASAIGLVLGLLLCGVALRAMRSVLYGIGVYDAPSILAVVATLSVVTLLAAAGPALRIARIDPATTLRDE
jgi:predicted permease